LNVLLAGKALDRDDWLPVAKQGELGLQTNWSPPDSPVALAADFLVSGRDRSGDFLGSTDQRGSTSELDLGVRKIWRPDSRMRPYLGGGVAFVSAELEFTGPSGTRSDHDGGAGLWLGGGVFWTLSQAFNIGLDAKATGARVRLFGDDKNAGGLHLGVLVGYHWGG
jgi:hypothetical protein